eukprot:TRINITY_DN2308_c0_g2_i4.p2 TRINITY_DN2308_c0_g2~~TRINITY_DN2308_c0_g2_i4.p2  ORF type:complete len:110 (-),score=52.44 TRINITY_DN2308_c0_g2_i4:2-331(-)
MVKIPRRSLMSTIGIGTQTPEQALASLSNMTQSLTPIQADEHLERIAKAQAYMAANNIDAIYLNAGTNLTYFTGMKWYASERMVGAILPAHVLCVDTGRSSETAKAHRG